MAGRGLGDSCMANGAAYGALDHGLMEEVTTSLVRLAVCIDLRRWNEPLPTPVGRGPQVLPSQGVRQFDETSALLQVFRV